MPFYCRLAFAHWMQSSSCFTLLDPDFCPLDLKMIEVVILAPYVLQVGPTTMLQMKMEVENAPQKTRRLLPSTLSRL